MKQGLDRPGGSGDHVLPTSARRVDAVGTRHSYVLRTGTGSGKSLAYIVPIVDRVLRDHATAGRRNPWVRAIVVDPMNALANSQRLGLERFLRHGYGRGREPVTFDR